MSCDRLLVLMWLAQVVVSMPIGWSSNGVWVKRCSNWMSLQGKAACMNIVETEVSMLCVS